MALVSLKDVEVLNNPSPFLSPFAFDITFECVGELKDDLEWRVIYVGSAESEAHDQELDSILVGPIPIGENKFTLEVPHPDADKIPSNDLLGVTVVLLTCSYLEKEFVRVGYYVNTEYDNEEMKENPPEKPVLERIVRSILADKPRVTRFNIAWDGVEKTPEPSKQGMDMSFTENLENKENRESAENRLVEMEVSY